MLSNKMKLHLFKIFFICLFGENLSFKVYWNVPTEECQRFGITFNFSAYNIIANTGDKFYGDKITIVYSPGKFPYFKDSTPVYGGIPQKADLAAHVERFREQVTERIPSDFEGYAVLDFEAYQPNYAIAPAIYKRASEQWVREKYPNWSNETIKIIAEMSFNQVSEVLFEALLEVGRAMRPGAKWGYYHYPYCGNHSPDSKLCTEQQMKSNNVMSWLINGSGALFPSVYLSNKGFDPYSDAQRVKIRIKEAKRVNQYFNLPILPYMRFKYVDYKDTYLKPLDLWSTLGVMWYNHLEGAIIWGSKSDVSTLELCIEVLDFLKSNLGPVVKLITSVN